MPLEETLTYYLLSLKTCAGVVTGTLHILRSCGSVLCFASLAVAIAVEVVYGARTSERNSITVLWTLKQPLLQLHAFLTWAIPLLCVNFQTSVQIETHDFARSYYEKVLATALTCRTAQ